MLESVLELIGAIDGAVMLSLLGELDVMEVGVWSLVTVAVTVTVVPLAGALTVTVGAEAVGVLPQPDNTPTASTAAARAWDLMCALYTAHYRTWLHC